MIALYRGTSPISRAIRFLNWSDYSHAAWVTGDGTCVEAWITCAWKLQGSVIESPCFETLHTKGTEVDFFNYPNLTPQQEFLITSYMRSQVGHPYDFRGIFKFLSRGESSNDDRWFCSELVFTAFSRAGINLLNLPAWKVYPGLLATSPLLEKAGTMVCEGKKKI